VNCEHLQGSQERCDVKFNLTFKKEIGQSTSCCVKLNKGINGIVKYRRFLYCLRYKKNEIV
jgi:hypothetical protein